MPKARPPARRFAGRCACGRVGCEVDDAFRCALRGRCSLCRRRTGSAFAALAGVGSGKLDPLAAPGGAARFEGRGWREVACRHCGSLACAAVQRGSLVHDAMGTLVEAPTVRASRHVHLASKAPWYEIADGLPQFEGEPPAGALDGDGTPIA